MGDFVEIAISNVPIIITSGYIATSPSFEYMTEYATFVFSNTVSGDVRFISDIGTTAKFVYFGTNQGRYIGLKSLGVYSTFANSSSGNPNIKVTGGSYDSFLADYAYGSRYAKIMEIPVSLSDITNDTIQNEFDSIQDAIVNIPLHLFGEAKYPITYRPTNCSFSGAPTEATVGDTVVVPVTFPDGYGIVNESDIYVTNNGIVIPSTYTNGQLTFTMPEPS